MPVIQNFSVPADDDVEVNIDVDPDDGVSLVGSTIYFRVYEQTNGVPTYDVSPVISKQTDQGIQVTDSDTWQFTVTIDRADTASLLRNYYFETQVVDSNGKSVRTTYGIMTVTQTENRGN
jgi:Flp pilus assembly protein TadG